MSLLTIEQVADIMHVSKRTIENLLVCGQFPPPIRIGRTRRWRLETVDQYLETLEGDAMAPVSKADSTRR